MVITSRGFHRILARALLRPRLRRRTHARVAFRPQRSAQRQRAPPRVHRSSRKAGPRGARRACRRRSAPPLQGPGRPERKLAPGCPRCSSLGRSRPRLPLSLARPRAAIPSQPSHSSVPCMTEGQVPTYQRSRYESFGRAGCEAQVFGKRRSLHPAAGESSPCSSSRLAQRTDPGDGIISERYNADRPPKTNRCTSTPCYSPASALSAEKAPPRAPQSSERSAARCRARTSSSLTRWAAWRQ